MIKKSYLIVAALCALVVGVAISFLLPSYILNLLQNPDGSYLSALLLKHQLKNPISHTPEFYIEYVPAVARRLIGLTFLVGAATALLMTKWHKDLTAFLNYSSTAFNLGILRVVIISQAIFFTDFSPIYSLPELSWEGMNYIPGYWWLQSFMPPSLELVTIGMLLYKYLCYAALVGLCTSWVLPILFVVAFWVQLGPHFVGKIIHYHHLLLGIGILALTPSGDALSADWLIRRWRGKNNVPAHQADKSYGRAFVLLWCMMGAVYFFPGFWKFVVGGFDWAFSENIQYKILTKIVETGAEPVIPLYNYPILCKLGGLATIIFEIAFPLAMIFPRGRILFGLSGFAFHYMNGLIMQIRFPTMERYYLSFFNWSWLLRRWQEAPATAVPKKIPAWKTYAGGILVGGLVVTGFLNIDSWPWAVYPTFAAIEEKFVNSVEMRILIPGEEPRKILFQVDPTMIEVYRDRTRLRAYMNQLLSQPNEDVRKQMLMKMKEIWKKEHAIAENAKIEYWHVLIPLWPIGSPAEPFKLLATEP